MQKMDLKQIEFWEKHYLDEISFILLQDIDKMMVGLKSKDKIKNDWIEHFKKSADKNSDFARGAERIYFWLFNQLGIPNSSPIGADLLFETYNAFVHISIAASKIDNPSDYKGEIPLGKNQTSYQSPDQHYKVSLPTIYSCQNKVCLTYFINIIYEELEDSLDVKGIFLICVPNGELFPVYKSAIVSASKIKGKGFRYHYKKIPNFLLLENKPYRLKKIFLSPEFLDSTKALLGIELEKCNE